MKRFGACLSGCLGVPHLGDDGGGDGGPEARAAVKRQDFSRKDKLCSWCSVEHQRLMECVNKDNPPKAAFSPYLLEKH